MSALISLVNTPGAAIERPSIGLGTLKAVLVTAGFDVNVHYANIWYAEHVGLDVVHHLSHTHTREGLFDWLFSGGAFPGFDPDHGSYIDQCLARTPLVKRHLSVRRLLDLREEATEFINTAAERILSDRPLVVGCTSTFGQHVAALALLRRIHAIDPSVITMMGGANCESIMGRTTHKCFDWIDFVVSGEAEELLIPLIKGVLGFGRAVPADRLPQGVFGPEHRKHGYPSVPWGDGAPRASVSNMGNVPEPNYDEFFDELKNSSFCQRVRPGLLLETSRGCWWGELVHCTFCGLNGGSMQYRSKPAEVVLRELQSISEKYGILRFEAVDNILDPIYFETLLPRLAESSQCYEIFYETKANLKRHNIQQMARAGIRWIQPGIESFDARVLRLIRKGCTPWHNIALLKWLRQYGIRVAWNVLYGVPGERDEWYAEQARLIPLLQHLEPCMPAQIQYSRYSPYFTDSKSFGLTLVPCASYEYIYPLSQEDLSNLVYFFDNQAHKKDENDKQMYNAEDCAGAREFMTSLILWKRAWLNEEPPTCSVVETSQGYIIIDTRACAIQQKTPVSNLCVNILDAADDGVARDKMVMQVVIMAAANPSEIDDSIDFLLKRKFLVEIDGRIVSIVLTAPVSPLPHESLFPGGFIAGPELSEGSR